MRFYTQEEAAAWAARQGFSLKNHGEDHDATHEIRLALPSAPSQLLGVCQFIARCLEPRDECLIWVTTWGVWSQSENLHLYYRLRQSYADYRLLHEAPGHLFLNYETADLLSFLEIAILSGWDTHIIPELQYGGPGTARVFVSHDEWIALYHADFRRASEWRQEIERANYHVLSPGAAQQST